MEDKEMENYRLFNQILEYQTWWNLSLKEADTHHITTPPVQDENINWVEKRLRDIMDHMSSYGSWLQMSGSWESNRIL